MKKTVEDFDKENEARKEVEFKHRQLPQVKVGQIWWYYVGLNIGQEISKGKPYQRPCLILGLIDNTSLIRIAPLTTKWYKKHRHKLIELKDYKKYLSKRSRLATHHICSIDKKRLIKKQSNKIVSKKFCRKVISGL